MLTPANPSRIRSRSGHGFELRGLETAPRSSVEQGRFGRMFRWLPPASFTEDALLALSKTMIQQEFAARRKSGEALDTPLTEFEPEDENPTITAGFTYLGQFIDHDITFDPVSSLERLNDPDALHDFRTPRLDLDSLYGMGPGLAPYLYEDDGIHLLSGEQKSHDAVDRFDLPRNSANIRRALIGDKRNDENLIVSQLHSAFIGFHNKVADRFAAGIPDGQKLEEIQRMVRWHYQWLALHQFLPTIVGEDMAKEVLGTGATPNLRFYRPKSEAYMPVEFAVACYRFGHSMIRPSYSLNTTVRQATGASENFNRIPVFSADDQAENPLANLNGFRELPSFWTVDWSFFFSGLPIPASASGLALPQPSYRIDTVLADPLTSLPEFSKDPNADRRMLAFRNLLRGWRLQLPSGQKVAHHLGVPVIPDTVLFEDRQSFDGQNRSAVLKEHQIFRGQAPLWYYILKEAELTKRKGHEDEEGGHHLGKVGGRIVAEVLVGLVWNDKNSYLRQQPDWKPDLGSTAGDFTIQDLFTVAGLQ